MNAKLCAVLGLLACSCLLAEEPKKAILEPAEPRWGDRIRLIYNPAATGAKLIKPQSVMAQVTIWMPGRSDSRRLWMAKDSARFVVELTAPEGASFVAAYFVTKDGYDGPVGAMIRGHDGKPARGAWEHSLHFPYLAENYEEVAGKELALYPDNWSVYRGKWFVAGAYAPAKVKDLVRADVKRIEEGAPARPADALYSLHYARLILDDDAGARRILHEMLDRFPLTEYTFDAFDDYDYHALAARPGAEAIEQVDAWKVELERRRIAAGVVDERDFRSIAGIAKRGSFPLEVFESICQAVMRADADNPLPYFLLALEYQRRQIKPHEGYTDAVKALDLLLDGQLRLREDIGGSGTQAYIPMAAEAAAAHALSLGEHAPSLAFARLAQSMAKETSPTAFSLEARIWNQLGRNRDAEQALREAFRRGDAGSRAALEESYRASHGSLDGFDEFLNAGTAKQKIAPAFHLKALDGNEIDSAKLRGKVVVVNFWFMGCAPCRGEMPELNKLVAEFKGKDVVFLGFTTDDEEDKLRAFLKDHPFDYVIVPRAQKVATDFGVPGYPTHAIIDASGNLVSFLPGLADQRADQLRTVLARLLK